MKAILKYAACTLCKPCVFHTVEKNRGYRGPVKDVGDAVPDVLKE